MLERADDADLAEVADLVNAAYRGTTGWTTEAGFLDGDRTTVQLLREELGPDDRAQLLVRRDPFSRRVLATVRLEPLDDGLWYLGSLAVHPDHQAGGLGRTVLAEAERRAREHGATRVRLTVVDVRDALIAWYVRRGYRLAGETQPFPYCDDRFGVPLRPDLAFVVLEKDL